MLGEMYSPNFPNKPNSSPYTSRGILEIFYTLESGESFVLP